MNYKIFGVIKDCLYKNTTPSEVGTDLYTVGFKVSLRVISE